MAVRLEKLKPGEMYPGTESFLGEGAAVMWVDSIARPRPQTWDDAAQVMLQELRMRRSERAVSRKRGELDSLLAAGWAFDSLGALWGGLARDPEHHRGEILPGLEPSSRVDSLVFGGVASRALPVGAVSDWMEVGSDLIRFRVRGRREPAPREVEQRIGQVRGLLLEYSIQDELKEMRRRYPVRIMDPTLASISMPNLPPKPEL